MLSFKLEFHNFVDGMPRMLPHNVDINICKGSSVFQIDFDFKISGETEIESSHLISHFPKLFSKGIHKVLNLNIDIMVLDVSLCTKSCLSVSKPEFHFKFLNTVKPPYNGHPL